MEGLWGDLETGNVLWEEIESREELEKAITEYIDYYTNDRPQRTWSLLTPMEFLMSNDWRHKNVARYTPGNTKILYFFNCLLDGMHTTASYFCVFRHGGLNARLQANIQPTVIESQI